MPSETSSPTTAWAPGENPKLTAVPLWGQREVSRREYLELLERRVWGLLESLGEREARELVAEWNSQELLPLQDLPLQEWPAFLLEEAPSVQGAVSSQAGPVWPKKAKPSKEASEALASVGFREWLSLALPDRNPDQAE